MTTGSARTLVGLPPHIHAPQSTPRLAWGTAALLAPALAWGVFCFGLQAIIPVGVAIAAALAGELVIGLSRRTVSLGDGTAFLTGLLIGLSMPPGVPFHIPMLASLFAVCIVKGAFGGLGANWMNPALGGVAFAIVGWPGAMSTWKWPGKLTGVAGISGATPLEFVHKKLSLEASGSGALSVLGASGFDFSAWDRTVTTFLNDNFFGLFGVSLPPGYMDLLFGNKAGAIGELSVLLLLLASIILVARNVIRWEIPAAILLGSGILTWIFGGLPYGSGYFTGDVLFDLFSGSLVLVAFFMATDPVTSPSTFLGRVAYGLAVGVLNFLLRRYGSEGEGIAFAVIIVNCFVPSIGKVELAFHARRLGAGNE